jgi:CMP/dCMP kinase
VNALLHPYLVIAIDGPAASGKSSVARALSHRLGFVYVNTGAMYRAVTWFTLSRQVPLAESTEVVSLLEGAAIECGVGNCESTIAINGMDPSPYLVAEEVNANVSRIAAIPEVRTRLVALQRTYAASHDIVMEGRDIGSAVFPETPYKFYIDASPEVRARRRQQQGLQDAILSRDRQDRSRPTSPLIIAEDAHVIDSSNLTVDGVVGEIIGRLKMHGLRIQDGRAEVER